MYLKYNEKGLVSAVIRERDVKHSNRASKTDEKYKQALRIIHHLQPLNII